jgi:hypothetical protein
MGPGQAPHPVNEGGAARATKKRSGSGADRMAPGQGRLLIR